MAQAQVATGSQHITRRAPNAHSEALQEAKRLEKMQSHGASHRTAGSTAGMPQQPASQSADRPDAAN